METLFARQTFSNSNRPSKFEISTRATDYYYFAAEMVTKLLGFDYEIVYKSGRDNRAADALSRQMEDDSMVTRDIANLSAFSVVVCGWVKDLKTSWQQDPEVQKVIADLSHSPHTHPHYAWHHDMLYYKNRLVVGNLMSFRHKLIKEHHGTPTGGHSGGERTYKRLKQGFYWRGMLKDVLTFVAECDVCQQNKNETVASPGLLQPLPIPDRLWSDISMDFIEGLPSSTNKSVVFVVVDRLSKYAHFMLLQHPYTASSVAQVFLDNVFKLHGMPTSIVSDRDPTFTSKFWQELFRLQGTQLNLSFCLSPPV